MALDLGLNKQVINGEYPVSVTSGTIEEGMALISIMENGQSVVLPGAGTANVGRFAGVAWGYFTIPTTAPIVDTGKVDATAYTFVLSQVPAAAGELQVYLGQMNTTTGLIEPVTLLASATSAPSASQYVLSGNTLTLNSANAGAYIYAVYRYNLTAQQAASLVGDGIPPTLPAAVTGTIGVIKRGRVYTNNFDTTVDWTTNPTNITVGANGQFTIGGSGPAVNGFVYSLPNADSAFLGIEFDAT